MLKHPELFQNGFHLGRFNLSEEVVKNVEAENWPEVDRLFHELTKPDGALFNYLLQYHDFSSIEFIISIRDSSHEWEEDGIWHDDGSRVFAFSLSLTLGEVEGGRLSVRRKGESQALDIPTPFFGGIILFLTGVYNFEHKINAVTKGKRIIIAGWCS